MLLVLSAVWCSVVIIESTIHPIVIIYIYLIEEMLIGQILLSVHLHISYSVHCVCICSTITAMCVCISHTVYIIVHRNFV